MKRAFSLLLALCLILSLLPVGTLAADIVDSGTCGENLTWTLDSDGLLTISGSGAMTDYSDSSNSPFFRNTAVQSVVIEPGVTTIGDHVFYHCSGMTDVIIPDSITSIGYSAFTGCTGLTSVTIPSSVSKIGSAAFDECTKLSEIRISDLDAWLRIEHEITNPYSTATLHSGALFGGRSLILNGSPVQDLVIPNGITTIPMLAFQGCGSLTSVTIGNSVTTIGGWAFFDCSSLTSVVIPDSITSIEDCAFARCSSLIDVYYTGSEGQWNEITIGDDNTPLTSANIRYSSCPHVETVVVNASEATCESDGYTGDQVCTACGKTIEQGEVIPATGHDWDDGVINKAATCTETGEMTYTCKNDASHTRTETIAALDHDWGEWIITKEATVTEEGQQTRTCSVCGGTETRVIPMLDHVEIDLKPIANGSSSTMLTINAGDVLTINVIGSSSSTYDFTASLSNTGVAEMQGSSTVTIAAGGTGTFTVIGVAAGTVSIAIQNDPSSASIRKGFIHLTVIEPCEHDSAVLQNVVEPTCTEKGYSGDMVCSVCGRTNAVGNVISARGHSWDQGVVLTEPTCTEAGARAFTCTNDASHTKTEPVPALGHTWGEWIVTKEASDTEAGEKMRTCSVCGEQETQEIPIPGTVSEVSVTPTTDIPSVSATIAVGGMLYINVTNGSSSSAYDFTATLSNSNIAQLQGSATVNIAAGGTGTFTVKGLADGNVDVTISNNNTYGDQYSRKAVIHLTVGEGGEVTPTPTPTPAPTPTPTPTPATGNVYELTNSLVAGKEYLIVSADSGSAYAMTNPGGSSSGATMSSTAVTIENGKITASDANIVWTASANGDGCNLTNGTDYLEGKGGNIRIYSSSQYSNRFWTYSGSQLQHVGGSMTYTLYYNSGFSSSYQETDSKVYLFVKVGGTPLIPPDECTHENLTAIAEIPASCETAGTEAYWKCVDCGTLFSDAEGTNVISVPVTIAALDHEWDSGVVTRTATCAEEGVLTFTCKHDASHTRTESIPTLPHTWSAWVTVIPASESETGVEVRACRVCKAIETRSIPRTSPFKDVPASAYYHDSVLWAYSHEPQITSGYTDGSFRPDQVCTRAQVVTFIWRAAGEPEPKLKVNPFRDVSESAYYYKAVLWAVENGVTTGNSGGTFNPDGECTRAQVVTFLWRAAGEPDPTSTTNPFRDVSASAYYYKAVLWALENGITTGKTSTTFNPTGKCTRAHVVTFLYRANT